MTTNERALLGHALDLAWSLWAELGVSTWERSHRGWAVELEPLIVFTAVLAEHDRRLLRETVGWCVAHDSYLSMNQLRHVVTSHGWSFEGPIGGFGATVSERSKRSWPGSRDEPAYDVTPTDGSQLRSLEGPALVQLRLRALFGVSARAEIIRVLLTAPERRWPTAEIAVRLAYTRRQIASDLEMLTAGGLTHRTTRAGSVVYALRDADVAVHLTGGVPEIAPPWAPVFRVMSGLLEAVHMLTVRQLSQPAVELARHLRLLEPALDELLLQPPTPRADGSYVDDVLRWAHDLFATLARGDASVLPADARVAGHRPMTTS
jgi:hypothetical protein